MSRFRRAHMYGDDVPSRRRARQSGRSAASGRRGFVLVSKTRDDVCWVMLQPAQASEPLAQASLKELQQRFPLPAGWTFQESFLQEASIGSLTLYMVGLVATQSETLQAMGSSTQADGYPVERAYFELLERISIYEARQPERMLDVRDADGVVLGQRAAARVFPAQLSPSVRVSLSNGIALHGGWREACSAARHELVERDRVLRSFAGELPAVRLEVPDSELAQATTEYFDSAAYEFGHSTPAPQHRTVMLFMKPKQPELPINYGFGCDATLSGALLRAEREAMQRLAFLWGEDLPSEQVEPTPKPDFHQDYYLYPTNHQYLFEWLEGRRRPRHAAHARLPLFDGEPVTYIDLTPESLRGVLAVAKAISPSARQLRFGLPGYPRGLVPHPVV
jgi:hypothetical protein